MTATIKAVVFDIGNVLIEWQPMRHYDRLIGPIRRAEFVAAFDINGMNERIDLGEDFRDTVYSAADANPEWRSEILIWYDSWIDFAKPEIPGSVALLRALRARGVACFALSNFGIETLRIAEQHHPFLTEFDRRFVSGHLRIKKPGPEIYALVEKEIAVAPSEIFFTDDHANNIERAQSRGWQTHLFEGPTGLGERLVAEGLLSADEAFGGSPIRGARTQDGGS